MAALDCADHRHGPTTCSLCQGHCRDPVITPCGHRFCPACVHRPQREVTEQITCPWCKEDFQGGKSSSHAWAGDEIDEPFLFEDPGAWPDSVCANHKEELNFFCVEDQTFICRVCREARSHQPHTVVPRREAETDMSQDLRRTRGRYVAPAVCFLLCFVMLGRAQGNRSEPKGWEKFPSSKPTSAASGDIHMADGDLAGLKDAPSFSRVLWMVLFLFLIAIGGLSATIFAFARAAIKPDGADPRPSAASCCPEGWIGAGGTCYCFSEDERNWEASQNYCSVHAASLAANGSLEALNITLHRKGPSNHWVGLRREPGQPWRWVDGAAFNHPFAIRGAGLCAYLADGVVSSAGCDTERKWACSKPDGRTGASPEDTDC